MNCTRTAINRKLPIQARLHLLYRRFLHCTVINTDGFIHYELTIHGLRARTKILDWSICFVCIIYLKCLLWHDKLGINRDIGMECSFSCTIVYGSKSKYLWCQFLRAVESPYFQIKILQWTSNVINSQLWLSNSPGKIYPCRYAVMMVCFLCVDVTSEYLFLHPWEKRCVRKQRIFIEPRWGHFRALRIPHNSW
jgi:hypothetical protein